MDAFRSGKVRAHLAKIAVSQNNSDTVFAAVPGALWSDSPDRGLYKTTDRGKTWNQVLKGSNLSTGCTDIAIDPIKSEHHIRSDVGFPSQRLGVSVRRRQSYSALSQWIISVYRRRQYLGGDYARDEQRVPQETIRSPCRGTRTFEFQTSLRFCGIARIARSLSPTMAVRPGKSATKANGWCGVRSTLLT